jgi:hypothetical protein
MYMGSLACGKTQQVDALDVKVLLHPVTDLACPFLFILARVPAGNINTQLKPDKHDAKTTTRL